MGWCRGLNESGGGGTFLARRIFSFAPALDVFDYYSTLRYFERGATAALTLRSQITVMTLLKILGVCGAILGLVAVVFMNPWVWIPDLYSDRLIDLGQMQTSKGDYFQVTQQFVGDGYLTCFNHTNRSGQAWQGVFDGDASRAWKATFEQTNNGVIIHAIRESFFYNLETHAMTNFNGVPKFVRQTRAS
jgi:hypothetical protein